jgi:uncharacterized protein
MSYSLINRDIITGITEFLNTKDIIVLHGARQVGKTSILKIIQNQLTNQNKEHFYVDLEDLRLLNTFNSGVDNVIKYLKLNKILQSKKLYLIIDEIQYLDYPSNFMKLMHDHHNDKIKLIVSGSSSFDIKKKFKDSLVGRTIEFNIYPLSFEEFLKFKNIKIDIGQKIDIKSIISELKENYMEYILYGGYPKVVLENDKNKKEKYLQQIIDTYIRKDIRDLAEIKDIMKFNKLLEILAAQSGSLLNVSELSNTAKLSRQTVENYLFLMENTYILKQINPFSSNLRSELFKTPKVFFYDTGIANLLWFKHLPETVAGNIFETSIFSELIKKTNINKINYWRTQDKKEIDFIIHIKNKVYPIEVKLSQAKVKFTAINYFKNNYKKTKSYIISLEIIKQYDNHITLYPWEINSI